MLAPGLRCRVAKYAGARVGMIVAGRVLLRSMFIGKGCEIIAKKVEIVGFAIESLCLGHSRELHSTIKSFLSVATGRLS